MTKREPQAQPSTSDLERLELELLSRIIFRPWVFNEDGSGYELFPSQEEIETFRRISQACDDARMKVKTD